MKYFIMPADFKKETIDEYEKLNNTYKDSRVIETYGNITIESNMESGRAVSQLPVVDLLGLQEFIAYSKQKNIDFNYTINAPHSQNKEFSEKGVLEIKNFLRNLYEVGCRSLTIALPSLVELVKSTGYDFKIKASTLCQITNANKALAYKRMGMERIVPDESINKDFFALKRIRDAFGDKIEIIVNPICYKDCIYRMFHYNQVAVDSVGVTNEVSTNYYEHRCVLQRYGDISNLLKLGWVRPEDLKYYTRIGIYYFKLQGRHLVLKGDAVRTLKAYLDETFDGDVMDLINMFYPINYFRVPLDNKKLDGFLKPFYEKENFCRRECAKCGYCEGFAREIIDYEKAKEVIGLAKNFYNSYDQYSRILNSTTPGKSNTPGDEDMEIDFELNQRKT